MVNYSKVHFVWFIAIAGLVLSIPVIFAAGGFEKDMGEPHPIAAANWDKPFRPATCTIVGSYTSIIRQGPGRFVAFNNSYKKGDLSGGLVIWKGSSPTQFKRIAVVLPRRQIDDLPDKNGQPHPDRMISRPFISWHKDMGFVGIIHVARGYPPPDRRVYPALVTSKTGAGGTWKYHGRLKGKIWEKFGDKGKARWASGGGLFLQPDKPAVLNRVNPLENRYVFFSDQYCKGVTILYSNDAKEWYFYRKGGKADGEIVNLTPVVNGKGMIFPHVVRMGRHGWCMFLSQKWPPAAIWRLWSPDGLNWKLFGRQPEIIKPKDLMIKNVNGWFDPQTNTLHGYLSVWANQPDGTKNYDKYHTTTKKLIPTTFSPTEE